jgi:hypothetical protein
MAKAKRVEVLEANVAAFIEKFAAIVWADKLEGVDGRYRPYPAREANRSFFGFEAAFQIVFGRKADKFELEHLELNFLEREHECLLARGKDAMGFIYPAWHPGCELLLKLRYRLGVAGGVKNNAEWQEVFAAARRAAPRRAA